MSPTTKIFVREKDMVTEDLLNKLRAKIRKRLISELGEKTKYLTTASINKALPEYEVHVKMNHEPHSTSSVPLVKDGII